MALHRLRWSDRVGNAVLSPTAAFRRTNRFESDGGKGGIHGVASTAKRENTHGRRSLSVHRLFRKDLAPNDLSLVCISVVRVIMKTRGRRKRRRKSTTAIGGDGHDRWRHTATK